MQSKPTVQRIKPTPGTSGVRLRRKNIISVYCEGTHSIYSVKVDFDMTVKQLLALVPGENLQVLLDDKPVNEHESLRSLGVTERSVVKVLNLKMGDKSGSTEDSDGADPGKYIGPRPLAESKPVQPHDESSLHASSLEEEFGDLNLASLAVPDLQLKKSASVLKKTFSSS